MMMLKLWMRVRTTGRFSGNVVDKRFSNPTAALTFELNGFTSGHSLYNVEADFGDVAQLAEHLLCKQGVVGSIPIVSTFLTTFAEELSSCFVCRICL